MEEMLDDGPMYQMEGGWRRTVFSSGGLFIFSFCKNEQKEHCQTPTKFRGHSFVSKPGSITMVWEPALKKWSLCWVFSWHLPENTTFVSFAICTLIFKDKSGFTFTELMWQTPWRMIWCLQHPPSPLEGWTALHGLAYWPFGTRRSSNPL